METMQRFYGITLEEAQKRVFYDGSFGYWNTQGNYMYVKLPEGAEKPETWVFLGESIFILGISAELDGIKRMVSQTDFIDIWPSVKLKYPQLFQEEVVGDLCLIL